MKMQKEKSGAVHHAGSPLPGQLAELNTHVSKAAMLAELYEKHANSDIRDEAELGHVQREMKVIKAGILSELAHSKSVLQQLQKRETGAD